RLQYGYDRDGNALWRNNLVNTAFGELYHTSGASNGYDGLNQLTVFSRGVLSSSGGNGILDTIASPSHSQSYNLDGSGNFTSITTDGTPVTRSNNQQNETTAVGSANLGYDKNGNTTTDDLGHTLLWDAWNRLVTIKSGTTVLETYAYDALNRRLVENSGTARDLYYSKDWQVLEEDVGGVMQDQYVWSPIYVDALVERDAGGTRLWAQQDADWNVTALVSSSGSVVERYVYDPIPLKVTVLTSPFSLFKQASGRHMRLFVVLGLLDDRLLGTTRMFPQCLQPHPLSQRLQHACKLLHRHPRKHHPFCFRNRHHHPALPPRDLIPHLTPRPSPAPLSFPVPRRQRPLDNPHPLVRRQPHAKTEQRRLRVRQRIDLRRQRRRQLAEGGLDRPTAVVRGGDRRRIGIRFGDVGQDVDLRIPITRGCVQRHRHAPSRQAVALLVPQLAC